MIGYSAPSGAGTVAAGLGGLFQGMQQGQQMNNNDEKMDMLRAQIKQETALREKGEINERLYNIRDIQKSGGNPFKSLQGLTKWMASSENFKDDKALTQGIWADHYDDNSGTYTDEMLNRYRSDTGKDFVEGKTDKQRPIMYGDKFFDFDTFSQGSPNFKAYARDKDMPRAVKENEIALHAKLKNKDKRTPVENTMLKSLDERLKLNPQGGVDDMFSDASKETLTQLKSGEVLNQDEVDNLVKAQIKSKQTFGKRDDYSKQVGTANNLVTTINKLNKFIEEAPSDTGWAQSMKSNILKSVGTENFAKMAEKEQRNTLLKSIKNSTAMNTIFDIIKQESGAAFTEDEFARRLQVLAGGDLDKINDQTLMTTLGNFTEDKIVKAKQDVGNISTRYSGDKAELYNSLNRGTKDFKAPGLDLVTKGGKETFKPIVAEIQRQVTELKDVAGDVIKGLSGKGSVIDEVIETGGDFIEQGKEFYKEKKKEYFPAEKKVVEPKLPANTKSSKYHKMDYNELLKLSEEMTKDPSKRLTGQEKADFIDAFVSKYGR